MKIKTPPPFDELPYDFTKTLIDQLEVPGYLELSRKLLGIVDEKGSYLHYDQLIRRLPRKVDPINSWAAIKYTRMKSGYIPLLRLGDESQLATVYLTPMIQRVINDVERNASDRALEYMLNQIGETVHLKYLIEDLIEDESISSSQLEGAATTTLAAKTMLKKEVPPKTEGEKMIIGNLKMMKCAHDKKDEPLSLELIQYFHEVGTKGINDKQYKPGEFREVSDQVVIRDHEENIIHVPPNANELIERLEAICGWVNIDHYSDQSQNHMHPLVKAMVMHFILGFEHPFCDGNGRVARCLFYWYMFKHGFTAFRYIAISTLLKNAPVKYVTAYLYSETDELDLTYFVQYQCEIVSRALDDFLNQFEKAKKEMERFNKKLYERGLWKKLTDNQKVILSVALERAVGTFTVKEVEKNLEVSNNTAANALNGLVKFGIFNKKKNGRTWMYNMNSMSEIIKEWDSKK